MDCIERPFGWMRCLAIRDENKALVATGVVFPSGTIVLYWKNGEIATCQNDIECYETFATQALYTVDARTVQFDEEQHG